MQAHANAKLRFRYCNFTKDFLSILPEYDDIDPIL